MLEFQKVGDQEVILPELQLRGVQLFVRREDLIHPVVSGNKFRKLKYNVEQARSMGYKTLLTFGGAFSNHIAAVAGAARELGFRSVGVIRGEETALEDNLNPTLAFAREQGMNFSFVSRQQYREKETPGFIRELEQEFGHFYLIPEGGSNALGVKGCEEIVGPEDQVFDYICCAMGTGATLAGISRSAPRGVKVLGFPALKGDFLHREVRNFNASGNWEIIPGYHFNGYAKIDRELVYFINSFREQTGIPLDPVYTGKMLYGILDLVRRDYFPAGSRLLAIHTGGLQGIAGMNLKLKSKNLPLIL